MIPPSLRTILLVGLLPLLLMSDVNAQTPAPTLKIGIVGDSTVSDYPASDPHRGWGQLLPEFFNSGTTFLNEAKAGASTKTFPPERWKKVFDFKPDFLLIQFGHNDQHEKTKPEATDAATDYKDNLRRYIKEARDDGAVPILITSMHRRTFAASGQVTTELASYVNAMKEVARK